jgi:hypothetical protein
LSTFAETDINPSSGKGIVPQGHLSCNDIIYAVRCWLGAIS